VLELALVGGVEHRHAHDAQLTDAANGSARWRDEVVVGLHGADLKHEASLLGEADELLGFDARVGEWLLGEDVLAGLERSGDDLAVGAGSEDEHRIDVRGLHDRAPVVAPGHVARQALGDLAGEGARGIADGRDGEGVAQGLEVGQVHALADQAQADHAYPDRRHHSSLLPSGGALSSTGPRMSTLVGIKTSVLVSPHHEHGHV
jgi:hypothetical protein